MKKFNISVPKKYTKKGEEKTAWNSVGKLIYFEAHDGKKERYVLELAMFPDTTFGVFEDVPDVSKATTTPEYPEEDINPDNIPF